MPTRPSSASASTLLICSVGKVPIIPSSVISTYGSPLRSALIATSSISCSIGLRSLIGLSFDALHRVISFLERRDGLRQAARVVQQDGRDQERQPPLRDVRDRVRPGEQ